MDRAQMAIEICAALNRAALINDNCINPRSRIVVEAFLHDSEVSAEDIVSEFGKSADRMYMPVYKRFARDTHPFSLSNGWHQLDSGLIITKNLAEALGLDGKKYRRSDIRIGDYVE